ncbi:helix-turn-helix domain-containing protein [Patescibacteria group bacterium]|nr:helix-turn-helix domain-containing protein [Patescibacteria group bacterium]
MENRYHIKWEGLRKMIRNPNIQSIHKVILVDLLLYSGVDGNCFPSQKTLAINQGKSERYIRLKLHELQKLGLISWERGGFGCSNNYSLNKELYILTDDDKGSSISSKIGNQYPLRIGNTLPTNVIKLNNQTNNSQSQINKTNPSYFIPCNQKGCSGGRIFNTKKNTASKCDCLISFEKCKKNGD